VIRPVPHEEFEAGCARVWHVGGSIAGLPLGWLNVGAAGWVQRAVRVDLLRILGRVERPIRIDARRIIVRCGRRRIGVDQRLRFPVTT
jgi:hypothetical protein